MKEEIEKIITSLVYEEYDNALANKSIERSDFEAYVDMLNCERTEKDYDWMSDIFVPEFTSHMLTQAGIDASMYFKSRDYVEVYVSSDKNEDLAAAEANKELINRTLNQKYLYYYQKYLRASAVKNLCGYTYLRCWWERKTKKAVVGHKVKLSDTDTEKPQVIKQEPIIGDAIVYDRFNFDVIDPRDVFTSNEYTYSLQQKKWITIRFDTTIDQLELDKGLMGYINLDKLKTLHLDNTTDTKGSNSGSYYTNDKKQESQKSPVKDFMVLERYGKHWVRVKKRDELDNPIEIEPGIDEKGEVMKDAELLEVIIGTAIHDSNRVLIRFQMNPYKDALGDVYRPIIRGLCYVHPTVDNGMGDGKCSRELQIAINDTLNMSNDRVKLATLPILKTNKFATEDNPTIYFEPGNKWELNNPDDVKELTISDNIQGALTQIGVLTDKMQQVNSTYPTTMGSLPQLASTTATAIAGAESRTDTRNNYKSLTFENTCLVPLYWMISQMTYQFAAPETAEKLLGDKIYDFNPTLDYTYKPVSAAIETASSRQMKINNWNTVLGYLANIPNPKAAAMINYILIKIAMLMGDEYENLANNLLDESFFLPPGKQGGQQSMGKANGMSVSNQNGMMQSGMEMSARNNQFMGG